MSEVDPGLETNLRSFLNEIKVQPLPRTLAEFGPSGLRPRRKVVNLFAGLLGGAVIAASVAVFAFELTGHHNNGSPVSGGQSAATPTPEPTPPFLPSPSSDRVPAGAAFNSQRQILARMLHGPWLIPKTYGSGTETLPTFALGPNEGIGVEYGCTSLGLKTLDSISFSGPGVPTVLGPDFRLLGNQPSIGNRCVGGADTASGAGGLVTVRVNADPSVRWVILVYEFTEEAQVIPTPTASSPASSSPEPTPPTLGEDPVPAGDPVLIPVTYGTGPMTLPSFTVTSNEYVSDKLGCLSTSPSVTTLTVNYYDPAFAGDTIAGSCDGPRGGGSGSGSTGFDGTVTLKVEAAPTEKWVIVVYLSLDPPN
jgi:hypothetical protein